MLRLFHPPRLIVGAVVAASLASGFAFGVLGAGTALLVARGRRR